MSDDDTPLPDRHADSYTYDEWVADPARPTIVLDVPGVGPVGLYTKRAALVAAIKARETTFPSTEVKRMFMAADRGSLPPEVARLVALVKKVFTKGVPEGRTPSLKGIIDADGWVLFGDEKPLPEQPAKDKQGNLLNLGYGPGELGRHYFDASESANLSLKK